MTTLTATDALKSFGDLMSRVGYGDERVVVTKHNANRVVMLSWKDFQILTGANAGTPGGVKRGKRRNAGGSTTG